MAPRSKSDSPVAAEEQLAQARGEQPDGTDGLEQSAKEQKKQQAEELAAGKGAVSTENDKKVKAGLVAAARRDPSGPVNQAKIDNLSARSGSDALEGHFVTVDGSDKKVVEALKGVGLLGEDDDEYVGDELFIYLEPQDVDPKTGFPETVVLRPRSSANARLTVPYDALNRTQRVGP